jgi:membrane protein implicated in regulation of membrane protease activity
MIIYAICLAVGLVFTIFSAITSHFFGGHDFGGHDADVGTGGHVDAGYDHSGLPGISFFSPTVLASFVTAFGACGLILERIPATKSIWISAPLSAVAGMLIASLTFLLFNSLFKKFQGSSESRVGTLIGHIASVATPIPPNGVGEISYVQGGSRYTAPARTKDGSAVTAGQCVRITRIVGSQFFVEIETEPVNPK